MFNVSAISYPFDLYYTIYSSSLLNRNIVAILGYQGQFCETDVDECSLYMQNTTYTNQGNDQANNSLKT